MRRRAPAHRDPATPMSSRRMAAVRALVASRLALTPAFAPRPGLRPLPFGGRAPSPRAALHASAPRPVARVAVVSGRAGRGDEGRVAEVGLPTLPVLAGGPSAAHRLPRADLPPLQVGPSPPLEAVGPHGGPRDPRDRPSIPAGAVRMRGLRRDGAPRGLIVSPWAARPREGRSPFS